MPKITTSCKSSQECDADVVFEYEVSGSFRSATRESPAEYPDIDLPDPIFCSFGHTQNYDDMYELASEDDDAQRSMGEEREPPDFDD